MRKYKIIESTDNQMYQFVLSSQETELSLIILNRIWCTSYRWISYLEFDKVHCLPGQMLQMRDASKCFSEDQVSRKKFFSPDCFLSCWGWIREKSLMAKCNIKHIRLSCKAFDAHFAYFIPSFSKEIIFNKNLV